MLKYHDDGKGKHQSHEVYDNNFDVDAGLGATKEQAFLNFKSNFEDYIINIQHYYNNEVKEENLVKVDWMGNPLKI